MIVVRFILSVIFIFQMYLAMAVVSIVFAPFVLIRQDFAISAVHFYCRYVRTTARLLVGLRSEIRGTVPTGNVLIASKHQSFFDIIIIVSQCPRPKFIMKRELLRAPFLGWYAKKIGCIPVDRGRRGAAIRKLLSDAKSGKAGGGQLIIYPQGTRVAPGADTPYKIGTGALYMQLGQICHPAATNVGVFWPRRGIMRKPGLAVIEFLDPIAAGLDTHTFMEQLENSVEEASDRLMLDAGYDAAKARAEGRK